MNISCNENDHTIWGSWRGFNVQEDLSAIDARISKCNLRGPRNCHCWESVHKVSHGLWLFSVRLHGMSF